jgi:hypothetical protein
MTPEELAEGRRLKREAKDWRKQEEAYHATWWPLARDPEDWSSDRFYNLCSAADNAEREYRNWVLAHAQALLSAAERVNSQEFFKECADTPRNGRLLWMIEDDGVRS